MNKKASVSIKFILLVGGFLIFAFAFGLFKTGSIVGFGDMNLKQTENVQWQNYAVLIDSAYFGTLTSGDIKTIDETTSYGSGWNVCGDNDGRITISNAYSTGDELVLSSSTTGTKGCKGNYIQGEVTLPAGELTGSCSLVVSNPSQWLGGKSSCKIGNLYSYSIGSDIREGQSLNEVDNIKITLDKPTTIKIYLTEETTDLGGTSSSKINLYFTPSSSEDISSTEQDPVTKQDTQNLSFIDKINLWIQDFFNGITGWFK